MSSFQAAKERDQMDRDTKRIELVRKARIIINFNNKMRKKFVITTYF
jgi:hypothetical protein